MEGHPSNEPGNRIEVLTADFWGGRGDGEETPADLQRQRVATVVMLTQLVITTILRQCDGYRDGCGGVPNMSDRLMSSALSKHSTLRFHKIRIDARTW
jgi:hypothetical protein